MWNRLLGLTARFCYHLGWNLLWVAFLAVIIVGSSISNLRKHERGKTAPPPVAVSLAELSHVYVDRDVIVSGDLHTRTYLQSGDDDRYYQLTVGGRGILVRFKAEPPLSGRVADLRAHVRALGRNLQQGLAESSNPLEGVRVRCWF